jgi:hypothetical protein
VGKGTSCLLTIFGGTVDGSGASDAAI